MSTNGGDVQVAGHVRDADVIFVAVNTPTKMYGFGEGMAAELKNIESVARMLCEVGVLVAHPPLCAPVLEYCALLSFTLTADRHPSMEGGGEGGFPVAVVVVVVCALSSMCVCV